MYVETVNAGPNERDDRGALEYVMHSYDWPSFGGGGNTNSHTISKGFLMISI